MLSSLLLGWDTSPWLYKMEIISQQSLSRFRDVKNIFFALFKGKRCNSWKHTLPFYTVQGVKISLSCSRRYQIPPVLQQPSVSKRRDGDISISSIYRSQNTSQPNIVKIIILILFPANTAILITSAEETVGTSLTKKFGFGNPSHSRCLSPELKYLFLIVFHIRKAVWGSSFLYIPYIYWQNKFIAMLLIFETL